MRKLFCWHNYKDSDRKFGISGYVVKCNKCGKCIGYSKEHNVIMSLSDKSYNEYIELFVKKKRENMGTLPAILKFADYSVYGFISKDLLDKDNKDNQFGETKDFYYIGKDMKVYDKEILADNFQYTFISGAYILLGEHVDKIVYDSITDTINHIKYLMVESIEDVITDPSKYYEGAELKNSNKVVFGFEALNENYKVTIEKV